jgi:hypothetical protein
MIQTTGKLVYDPNRGEDFRKQHKTKTLIVELPRDQMDLYYQWFLTKQYGQWITMQRPMYGIHCTVVRGDEKIPQDRVHLWKKYHGQKIELMYDPEKLKSHWKFWSIPVFSQRLNEIRSELGLRPSEDFHITVGRMYPWQAI